MWNIITALLALITGVSIGSLGTLWLLLRYTRSNIVTTLNNNTTQEDTHVNTVEILQPSVIKDALSSKVDIAIDQLLTDDTI